MEGIGAGEVLDMDPLELQFATGLAQQLEKDRREFVVDVAEAVARALGS